MNFGEHVRQIMQEKGIKQNELAREIGMSSSGISTALRDDSNPRLDTNLMRSNCGRKSMNLSPRCPMNKKRHVSGSQPMSKKRSQRETDVLKSR